MIKVSIIVPVFEGQHFIKQFFNFTKSNSLPPNIELLIVDNGSSKIFYENLLKISDTTMNCRVLRYSDKQSSYAARNYGASRSSGQVIAFTDFDCVLTKQYIKTLQDYPITEINLVSGKIELFHVKNNIYEIFDRYAYLKQEEYFDNNYAATANLLLAKDTFEKLKGFKELTSGGDNEFCKRAVNNGFEIDYCENLLVKHPLRGTYNEHIKKSKRLGRGHGQLFKIKKKNRVQKFFFLVKTSFGIFIPIHQIFIFYKIMKVENIKFKEIFSLFRLCYAVGMFQRYEIIKKSI